MLRQLNLLMNLPDELVSHILQFCSYRDILRFSMTCRTYLEVVNSAADLQLHIELEASRVQLSRNCAHISPQELLEALKRHRDNWLDLNLNLHQTILTRVRDGETTRTQWVLQDGLFSDAFYVAGHGLRLANQIQMIPLDNPESRWSISLEVSCHDFITDPNQDLLALATINRESPKLMYIYFRSLLTGLRHPLAMEPVINFRLEFRVDTRSHSDTNLSIIDELLIIDLVSSSWNEPSLPPLCDVLIIN
ncbi:hypothetical protein FRC12_005399 [Ceratobasidium sp. 428]|nr:hypothetical protein FRC12_005399 [Ceratobasidium sp. 428]